MTAAPTLADARFRGVRITRAPGLAGAKRAVRRGDTIYVSPAMHALLVGAAAGAELQRLLGAIEVVAVPEMTTTVYAPVNFYTVSS